MAAPEVNRDWMWHPNFSEEHHGTAGLFVQFRKTIVVENRPTDPLRVQITADTRYKLYVNYTLVTTGPVKGDQKLWFYDEIDIQPFLISGKNKIAVQVLRFFYPTKYASSFPRLPVGGLMIRPIDCNKFWHSELQSSASWETAIDPRALLATDLEEDDFLHIYEKHHGIKELEWTHAKVHEFQVATGLRAPWKLSPRMIPPFRSQRLYFTGIHNINSPISEQDWKDALVGPSCVGLDLEANTKHYVELEVDHHTTAFLEFLFRRPEVGGSLIKIKYAESYEDLPPLIPYLRSKGDRRDHSKALYGPHDVSQFRGFESRSRLEHYESEGILEIFAPFHFRTFRFIGLQIDVGPADLYLWDIGISTANYPLDTRASFNVKTSSGDDDKITKKLWETSIRTLSNCMHDCYEDCPFYEQLQYCMDMRSSALFTYYASGDDRLARQALIQIHNSFDASVGLTASRSPCHQLQIIPNFSLYWICAIFDHYTFFGDKAFIRQFVAVIDGIFEFFNSRIDPDLGLTSANYPAGMWDFTDWTEEWRPHGIPPAAERTGFSTYTNALYAYTLKNASVLLRALGRSSLAEEYAARANAVVKAIREHCFDGNFFTDGLAKPAHVEDDYSVTSQVFAALCGAATGSQISYILAQSLASSSSAFPSDYFNNSGQQITAKKFVQPSLAMSFYTLRALSLSQPNNLYDSYFQPFFTPWRAQLALNLTTWEEDAVSQRSDCHAWGSSPIYEFLAEVAGVQPAEPGWAVVRFRPRLVLFGQVEAKVPVGKWGVVCVKWNTEESSGNVSVSLNREKMDTNTSEIEIPLLVELPSVSIEVAWGGKALRFVVKGEKMVESVRDSNSESAVEFAEDDPW
ncbi:hypothetical protein H072_10349 [Dactylellina haptotyla CBS 200.50]|uniref:Alpha-L-rhamnosidase six-hairpin glycosidase domain-containing protein n=1 Tax=Dactylellina haptotyla (strain CBS 200.50) TaxID=1284197 RepID=S8BLQ8_DACHA|nr:hypothetical protein H072_10349 [Dactylellina haptotyla CBS 200.50]